MFKFLPIEIIKLSVLRPKGFALELPTVTEIECAKTYRMVRPLLVYPSDEAGVYEIITGESAWFAAQQTLIPEVPALIREDLDVNHAQEIYRLMNRSHPGVNAIIEAELLHNLLKAYQVTTDELAQMLGKRGSTIRHKLRLANLCEAAKSIVANDPGHLKVSHLKPLVTLSPEQQVALLQEIVQKKLSSNAIESLVKKKTHPQSNGTTSFSSNTLKTEEGQSKYTYIISLIRDKLQSEISVENGKLVINFYDNQEILEGIAEALGVMKESSDW